MAAELNFKSSASHTFPLAPGGLPVLSLDQYSLPCIFRQEILPPLPQVAEEGFSA